MRIPKRYGERTRHFKETQDEKTKYIFLYEGQETEVQYFQGIIDNRENLGINPLVELQPVLRSRLDITNSHPLNILDYFERYIREYNSIEMIARKIVDYCYDNLDINESTIYSIKNLYDDVVEFLCSKYPSTGDSINLTNEVIIELSVYLSDKVNILEQVDRIREYISEQLIIYNEEIDKICLIVDRDCGNVKPDQYDLLLQKCNDKKIQLYVSNPTFEFWLLLHSTTVMDIDRGELLRNKKEGKKRFLERQLSIAFEGYKKNHIKFEKFMPYIDLAIEQEAKFCQEIKQLKVELGSNIGKLIECLKKDESN